MAKGSLAGDWLKENGLKWKTPRARTKAQYKPLTEMRGRTAREMRVGRKPGGLKTAKRFVEDNRDFGGEDCLFVPSSVQGRPSRVPFCGGTISAARYMALLIFGTPKQEGAMVRHLCGNGHLSCVNPKHLRWGDASDNQSDAVRHRSAQTVEEKIAAVTRD